MPWVIDPRKATFAGYWDLVTTIALFYVAVVTPIEVGFIESPDCALQWTDGMFLINRLLDCIFILDMIMQLRLGYKSETLEGTQWVLDARSVALHYLTSYWFPLDFFSVLVSALDMVCSSGDLAQLKAVRTLRLLKLAKLARASRVFKRWETRISIDYAALSLVTVVAIIIFTCHWTACIWGLVASLDPLLSWAAAKEYCVPYDAEIDGQCRLGHTCFEGVCDAGSNEVGGGCSGGFTGGYDCIGAWDMYVYSLYFAIMTVTSVGYGDISASAFNPAEQLVCSLIMLGSGMMWGYLVGVFCTLAVASPSVQAFRDELSQLNAFMAKYHLEPEMRYRLREFFHETVHLRSSEAQTSLLSKLSPSMHGEVSLLVNHRWVSKVWYLRYTQHMELLIDIANKLTAQVIAPQEFVPSGEMRIVERGTAIWAGRLKRAGSAWGEDILLTDASLRLAFPAYAATYLWLRVFNAAQMRATLGKYPAAAATIAIVCRRWTLRRKIVRHAERVCFAEGKHFRGRVFPIYASAPAPKALAAWRRWTHCILISRDACMCARLRSSGELASKMQEQRFTASIENASKSLLMPKQRRTSIAPSKQSAKALPEQTIRNNHAKVRIPSRNHWHGSRDGAQTHSGSRVPCGRRRPSSMLCCSARSRCTVLRKRRRTRQ